MKRGAFCILLILLEMLGQKVSHDGIASVHDDKRKNSKVQVKLVPIVPFSRSSNGVTSKYL